MLKIKIEKNDRLILFYVAVFLIILMDTLLSFLKTGLEELIIEAEKNR